MKTKILFFPLLFVAIAAMAGSSNLTVLDLIKDCGQFADSKKFADDTQFLKGATEDGTPTEISANEIREILNLDVVSFYNIKGYDTDLKKEIYKETEEYKEYESMLKKKRDEFKTTTYFYAHKLRNVYNFEKSGFLYEMDLDEYNYVNFPGYINHGTLCIEYATKRFPKNHIEVNKWWGGSYYHYAQRIVLSVPDKRVALRIEEAERDQIRVLFIFKIDSTKKERPNSAFWPHTFILTKTEGIYIVNIETGEVYCKVL